MSEELSTLLIKRIIANVGGVPFNDRIPRRGLMESNLLLNNPIQIKYDTGIEDHDVYVGQIVLDVEKNLFLKGLLVDLSIDDVNEFLFVFRLGNLPIHAAKSFYHNFDNSDFGENYLRIWDEEKNRWNEASLALKAKFLAEFETIVNYGFLWEDLNSYQELIKSAKQLLNYDE